MSGFYEYSLLNTETRASIESVPDTTGATDDKTCGCHKRGDRWWICQYHEGYEEGVDRAKESKAHARLEEMGIDRERLKTAVDNDNWGHLVHAFEILSVCGVVLDTWEESE